MKKNFITEKFFSAGVHAVINTIDELPFILDKINENLVRESMPQLI